MNANPPLTPVSMETDSIWNDVDWLYGQLFMMGFDGTEVTPQIKQLIEVHHIGTILLTAKNLRCKETFHSETTQNLQVIRSSA